jgi:hypothetical protein
MQTQRILAIADVRIASPSERANEVVGFYTRTIGLDRVVEESGDQQTVFRSSLHRRPRILVRMVDTFREEDRRRVLIQIPSLRDCMERLTEARTFWNELRGWAYYDRRICTFDPAGNLVELVCYHPF